MSADICPECNEQAVRGDECGYCGWSDYEDNLKVKVETLKAENERLRRQIKIIQCDEDGWIKKNYILTEQLRICKEKAESALPFTQSEIFTLASDWVNKYTEEK